MTTRQPSGEVERQEIDRHRRRFFGTTAMAVVAAQLGISGNANGQAGKAQPQAVAAAKPGPTKSFGPLRQIATDVLNVGYAQAGPAQGPPVILLHGWPYDIHSYVDVAPLLASAGYRVLVPYVRGYGTTRFLSAEMFRNGQPSAVALDVISSNTCHVAAARLLRSVRCCSTVDDGREEQVLDRIVKASILETFRARTRPEKLTDVVTAFESGLVVHTGEDIAASEYAKVLDRRPGAPQRRSPTSRWGRRPPGSPRPPSSCSRACTSRSG